MIYDLKKLTSLLPKTGYFTGEGMYYFDEIDSTNLWLLKQKSVKGKFCIAADQTAGRGRRGKSWLSDSGSSLLLSMGWSRDNVDIEGLSLISGLAVLNALTDQGVSDLKLKWPNDVLADGKKLAGILVELSGDKLVIGVGINVTFSSISKAQSEINQPWTDLTRLGCSVDRERLVVDTVRYHENFVAQHKTSGFGCFADKWNQVNAYQNQKIIIINGKSTQAGIMEGVNKKGALILKSEKGSEEFVSGEVSVRQADDTNNSRAPS